ncbi:Non-canonical poly(A) RNA polymerase papd5 [Quaeritorhiza haematococci]|nr:Non-canonical poly(A) RNA polymerase papd5 [Quaeritorhiza haematococci]
MNGQNPNHEYPPQPAAWNYVPTGVPPYPPHFMWLRPPIFPNPMVHPSNGFTNPNAYPSQYSPTTNAAEPGWPVPLQQPAPPPGLGFQRPGTPSSQKSETALKFQQQVEEKLKQQGSLAANHSPTTLSSPTLSNADTVGSDQETQTQVQVQQGGVRVLPSSGGGEMDRLRREKLKNLTEEIKQFVCDQELRKEERCWREYIRTRTAKLIKEEFGEAVKILCFGSSYTGLAIPQSDIDLVCVINEADDGGTASEPSDSMKQSKNVEYLRRIQAVLQRSSLPHLESIKLVSKAYVPVLKFDEKYTRIRVDITMNNTHGRTSSAKIREWMQEYPLLRPMVVLMKHYLWQRSWSEVYTGGIGGYLLINLVVYFLQKHTERVPDEEIRLGHLFYSFLGFYGKHFNYDTYAISAGTTKTKDELRRSGWPSQQPKYRGGAGAFVPDGHNSDSSSSGSAEHMLWVVDPSEPDRDLARGAYNYDEIQQQFREDYIQLHLALLGKANFSSLKDYIRVDEEWVSWREFVINMWQGMGLCDSIASVLGNPMATTAATRIVAREQGANTTREDDKSITWIG